MRLDSSISKQHRISSARETNTTLYRGILGEVNVQTKSGVASKSSEDWQLSKKAINIMPSFINYVLEMCFMNKRGYIPRTLNIYPVLSRDAPVFDLCCNGDIEGLQSAFSTGSVSPFVLTESGRSLLDYAALFIQPEMCAFLLRLGVNPDRPAVGTSIVDTLRILVQAKDDISSIELLMLFERYSGPPEGLEYLLSQDLLPYGDPWANDDRPPVSPLAVALGLYPRNSAYKTLIQKLVREGADLHAWVSWPWLHAMEDEGSARNTPLDELFYYTESSFQAKIVGDDWLRILSSEGHDIRAYLLKEEAYHTRQMQRIFLFEGIETDGCYPYRQLIFELGDIPSVSWDWWTDPESSAFLLLEEFKDMNIRVDDLLLDPSYDPSWKTAWPVIHADWSDCCRWGVDIRKHRNPCKIAQARAHKRLEKRAAKLARFHGLKFRITLPGSWPD